MRYTSPHTTQKCTILLVVFVVVKAAAAEVAGVIVSTGALRGLLNGKEARTEIRMIKNIDFR